jgi:hypothetical protein
MLTPNHTLLPVHQQLDDPTLHLEDLLRVLSSEAKQIQTLCAIGADPAWERRAEAIAVRLHSLSNLLRTHRLLHIHIERTYRAGLEADAQAIVCTPAKEILFAAVIGGPLRKADDAALSIKA